MEELAVTPPSCWCICCNDSDFRLKQTPKIISLITALLVPPLVFRVKDGGFQLIHPD